MRPRTPFSFFRIYLSSRYSAKDDTANLMANMCCGPDVAASANFRLCQTHVARFRPVFGLGTPYQYINNCGSSISREWQCTDRGNSPLPDEPPPRELVDPAHKGLYDAVKPWTRSSQQQLTHVHYHCQFCADSERRRNTIHVLHQVADLDPPN